MTGKIAKERAKAYRALRNKNRAVERETELRNRLKLVSMQRGELLTALEVSNFYLTAIVNGAEIDAEETNIKVCLNSDEVCVINLAETIKSAESTIARMKGSAT